MSRIRDIIHGYLCEKSYMNSRHKLNHQFKTSIIIAYDYEKDIYHSHDDNGSCQC